MFLLCCLIYGRGYVMELVFLAPIMISIYFDIVEFQ
jgi:hypothetical protein